MNKKDKHCNNEHETEATLKPNSEICDNAVLRKLMNIDTLESLVEESSNALEKNEGAAAQSDDICMLPLTINGETLLNEVETVLHFFDHATPGDWMELERAFLNVFFVKYKIFRSRLIAQGRMDEASAFSEKLHKLLCD